MNTLKTRQQAIDELANKGISVRRWAMQHGLSPAVVHSVLKMGRPARIGESHKAAVLLGIKRGEIA